MVLTVTDHYATPDAFNYTFFEDATLKKNMYRAPSTFSGRVILHQISRFQYIKLPPR